MGPRAGSWMVFLGGLIAAVLAVVVVIVISGGGDGSPEVTAAPTTSDTVGESSMTSAPEATAGTPAPGTTSPAPPSSAVAVDACVGKPSIEIPASAADLTTWFGDMDGDGVDDGFSVYRVGAQWKVHVRLAGGHGVEADLTPYAPGATPWSERVIDVGFQEELGLVGSGFTLVGPIYQVWQLAECALRRATSDGGDFEPYVGVGLAHGESFACTSNGMVQYETSQPGADPNAWVVTETGFTWDPLAGDFHGLAPTVSATAAATAQALVADIGC